MGSQNHGNSLAMSVRWLIGSTSLLVISLALTRPLFAQVSGPAKALARAGEYTLSNGTIEASWRIADRHLSGIVFTDRLHNTTLPMPSPFAILVRDGSVYTSSNLTEDSAPQIRTLAPSPDASQFAERLPGKQIDVPLASSDGTLHLIWSAVLREGSAYQRQVLTITASPHDIPITRVVLLDLRLPGAHVVGSVKGSPIVAGNLFMGF